MRKIILGSITAYQKLLSPLLGPRCRFYPTCSHYAAEAVQIHGAAKGSWLSTKRILRCHPFHAGGIDLVPEASGSPSTTHKNTLIKGEQAHG
ncbi:MAG: membrane protein insertion efficiency factor YidD [Gammaproteobacteria bacterium]